MGYILYLLIKGVPYMILMYGTDGMHETWNRWNAVKRI